VPRWCDIPIEALVIKADGSLEVKGSVNGVYWESQGTIKVVNNKMTIKMSANDPAYQDVEVYAFQDQDNRQMLLSQST
jgi:hypothetical protein